MASVSHIAEVKEVYDEQTDLQALASQAQGGLV
jgi:hypothetical protein